MPIYTDEKPMERTTITVEGDGIEARVEHGSKGAKENERDLYKLHYAIVQKGDTVLVTGGHYFSQTMCPRDDDDEDHIHEENKLKPRLQQIVQAMYPGCNVVVQSSRDLRGSEHCGGYDDDD